MQRWLSLLLIVFTSAVCGQDTLHLKPVVVFDRYDPARLDHTIQYFDSLILSNYSTSSVADVLKENSPVFIKSYGNGGLSTISVRGTSSVHTAVLWNGIPVNLQSTGDLDLSLFPPSAFESIGLMMGGESSVYGSGSIGGNLLLEDRPDFSGTDRLGFTYGYGNYGKSYYSAQVKTGTERLSVKLNVSHLDDKNEFTYINHLSPEKRQQTMHYAAVKGSSANSAVFYRKGKNVFSLHSWIEDYARDIPASIFTSNPYAANQTDRNFRNLAQYNFFGDKLELSAKAALINGELGYTDTVTDVISHSQVSTFHPEITIKKPLWKGDLFAGTNASISQSTNNNYSGRKYYNMYGIYAGYSVTISKWLYNLNCREDIISNGNNAFTFNASAAHDLNKYLRWSISSGRSFRAPSLNDLFWVPGGNPDLKPEHGWFAESGLKYIRAIGQHELTLSGTYYVNYIKDWIIWLPQTQIIWTPRNLKTVLSKGVEAFISDRIQINKIKVFFNASYSYTEATNIYSAEENVILNDQLMYVPYYVANGTIRLLYKQASVSVNGSFTGGRYITSDHTAALPSYLLGDVRISYTMTYKKQNADLFFAVRNFTNERYQVLENRPMPGRTYEAGISIKLNK
jgi:vitamin B12 transporter